MYYFLSLFVLLTTLSCTSIEKNNLLHSVVFPHSFSTVWSAALLVLKDYPIETEIKESGEIKTKMIRGYEIWEPPEGMIEGIDKRTYQLEIVLRRGLGPRKAPYTHVSIMKNEFEDKDFIQQNIPVPSNGIEENLILYRIQRELFLMDEVENFKERKRDPEGDAEEMDI